jgi:hypothetical protein
MGQLQLPSVMRHLYFQCNQWSESQRQRLSQKQFLERIEYQRLMLLQHYPELEELLYL